jgi:hypothetical protein
MRSITCPCNHVFEADIPDSIDLDADSSQLKALADGDFLAITCPSCGYVSKPEFPLEVVWASHDLTLKVIPELERGDFYLQPTVSPGDAQVVIGYPELADRIAVVAAGLDVLAIEALKYYLLVKAEEAAPDAEVGAWFSGRTDDIIEFHLHGLREGEVAVSRVPFALYERTLADSRADADSEPFASLRFGPYLSVQNILRPEVAE